MIDTPAFLDSFRPHVPDLVVPGGVTPFFLPGRPVRGRLVRLGRLADALLTRHDNHDAVTALTGQALALVAALATALKFRGSFSLQAKGYAQCNAERLAALLATTPEPSAAELLGQGYLAFTVDQGPDTERHQGIVTITGDSLAGMALHYFETSEQLRCSIRLACSRTEAGWRAGALIVERIAADGGVDLPGEDAAESCNAAEILAGTLSDAELLDDGLAPEDLLYRLFHTEGVAADLPRVLAYGCRCSRQRLSGILESFPPADLDDMVVDGEIVMTCEFCNVDFRFARDEVHGQNEDGA